MKNSSNLSKLALAFEYDEINSVYSSPNEYFEKEIKKIFENLNKLNKGIVSRNLNEELEEIVLEIDNKYYNSKIKLGLINLNQKDFQNRIPSDIEGLIIFWSSEYLGNFKKITQLVDYLNNGDNPSKPTCCIIVFNEDRTHLNSFSEFPNFVEFSIDNNFEIIAGIKEWDDKDEDDGIGALNLSLQSNTWASAVMKSKNSQAEIKAENISLDKAENTLPVKVEQTSEDSQIPYEELRDDMQFDNLLEKMNEIRRINMSNGLSDEERRRNAENAILMFAKFLDLDEGEENDSDNENS